MRKGEKITLNFHAFGVVSQEECTVIDFTDKTVTIDDTDEGRIFSRNTGECLNDGNSFGGYRTIKPC